MESKKGGLEQLVQPLKQVQVDDQFTHPSIHQSFVASGRCIEPDAPALWSSGGGNSGIEPFGTGGDTHTHTHMEFSGHVSDLGHQRIAPRKFADVPSGLAAISKVPGGSRRVTDGRSTNRNEWIRIAPTEPQATWHLVNRSHGIGMHAGEMSQVSIPIRLKCLQAGHHHWFAKSW